MSDQRERFEAYIIDWRESSGIEHSLEAHPLNPDSYEEYAIQLAWQSWQAACPEGWQAVPMQPVDQQIDAGCEATGDCERLGECHHDCDCSVAPKVYRAMLSAAPKPGDVCKSPD